MTRVAVVTGASRGIGRATCELLSSRGWQVVPIVRERCRLDGELIADVGDAEALAGVLGGLPRVDALVNNAAIQMFKDSRDLTVAEWDRVMGVNLRSAFVAVKALRALLIESRGAVVNVSSVHASATSSSTVAYATAKGGLVALGRSLAVELGPDGVRVNTVSPGAIKTAALEEGLSRSAGAREALEARTPLRRVGTPAEVAELIEFLIDGTRSGFITGQEFVVDGGALALLGTEG